KTEQINRFVIAACSGRYYQSNFDFGGDNLTLRVPIREYASWMGESKDEKGVVNEDNQMLAEDYIRMYCTKAKTQDIPENLSHEVNRSLLVIGGGVGGMTAAVEAAKAGYHVNLVEKSGQLGGFGLTLGKAIPTKPPFLAPEANNINQLVTDTEGNQKIDIHISSKIGAITGEPGNFTVQINNGSASKEVKSGAVVLATGAKPYDANRLTHLGIENDNVVSSVDFEKMLKEGRVLKKDGNPARTVAFIQCAGSRDSDHLPYCSSTCCMTSLRHAASTRQLDDKTKVFIIYKDMRTPGLYEDFYRNQQDDPGIFLTKGEIAGVKQGVSSKVLIDVDNSLVGEKVRLEADLLVLAVGQVPAVLDEESPLNLGYRQGKDLPDLKYGYPDSHFICFPYETRRTGIFSAGSGRQPMDANYTRRDAAGAALKAIQTIELTALGKTVHPRAGDETKPRFNLSRCTACKRCTEECPFGAIEEDDKAIPEINTARCRSCGTCMGACPERIISFADYSVNIISEMSKNIEMPDEFDEKPRVLVFACENDALPALDLAAQDRLKLNTNIRIIPLRCLGGTNLVYVSDALSVGYDGILFLGCKFGDDYQCHFVKGSELCNERLTKVQETIGRLNLEPERVKQIEVNMNDYAKLPGIIDDFVEEIDEFGPNPFKGM
ncbi:MAG: hydrogenase iron-sulfur subunit, partial [Proteobacteria bacterium]|nr:hydrogenase iron-sulfur subunit [Pseudomonadota bacterium]